MAATSTYMTFLMHKNGEQWEKLIDIKTFGDLGGEPEQIETTTLSNKMQTYVNGVQSTEALQFTANYDHDEFAKLKAIENKSEEYAVWFGGTEGDTLTPTGTEGKFSFGGQLSVYVAGAGVNEVREMTISISPTTDIKDVTTAG